jgi:2-alkenal reductase
VVVQAAPGSPAARAGLRGVDLATGAIGDIIVEADGKPVRRLSDLVDAVEQIGVGKSLQLGVVRDGRKRTVDTEIVDIGRT